MHAPMTTYLGIPYLSIQSEVAGIKQEVPGDISGLPCIAVMGTPQCQTRRDNGAGMRRGRAAGKTAIRSGGAAAIAAIGCVENVQEVPGDSARIGLRAQPGCMNGAGKLRQKW